VPPPGGVRREPAARAELQGAQAGAAEDVRRMRHTSFDGTGIAWQRWDSATDAALPPVVLHHGYAVDANVNWVAPGIVAALPAAGRDVVAVDARGHGASDKPHSPDRYG